MLRSNQPASSTDARKTKTELPPVQQQHASQERPLRRRFLSFARWLHIYISMLGLAVILFFSVTGITLNHPSWFFGDVQHTNNYDGDIQLSWLNASTPASPAEESAEGDDLTVNDEAVGVAKLEVVEYLRNTHGARGAVSSFTADSYECVVVFKGPGYSADAFIDRESGHYTMTETIHGVVAVVNDLHKGRNSGVFWSIVIDVSALLTTIASLTGLLLLLFVRRHRGMGIVAAAIGTVLAVIIFVLAVP